MRTPYHGTGEPFPLRSNVIFFHDWRYVHHGDTRWETKEGETLGLWSAKPIPPLRWAGRSIPRGIRLKTIPAGKSEPIIVPDRPWEGVIFGPTVMRIDGLYRMWYETVPPEDLAGQNAGERNLLCYAESTDGVSWHKPSMELVSHPGWEGNNIVYGGPLAPRWGYHGSSVFLDPSCPAEQRYKIIHLGFLSREDFERFKTKTPDQVDPISERSKRPCGVFGATSPDGIHWTPLAEPLVLQNSDTQNIAYYDEFLGKYVAYFRTWVMGRRSIGRAESSEFRRFPLPETLIWPGPAVGPSDLWYGNGRTAYPGAADYHLMFAKRWRVSEDRFYVHLATSPDGIIWGMTQNSQILGPGEPGGWDAGGVSVGCGMVELQGDRVGVPFIGFRVPHKYTRTVPLGRIAWAFWRNGRLVALVAQEEGEFRTMYVNFSGDELHLNVRTAQVGEVRVEVLGRGGKPVDGRTMQDCDPINGDFLDRTVTWREDSRIGHKPGESLAFHVKMSWAELYSMAFR